MKRHSTASEFWGEQAARYDGLIRRTVPFYDTLTDRLIASLPGARRVLELGCGTGNVSIRLASALPAATFTFVDASPEMTAVTRARLEAVAPATRADFVEARFEELPARPDGWDLVVASLSLHHLSDPAPFYALLADSMAPGAALRMADAIRAADPAHHTQDMTGFRAFWDQPGHLDPEERVAVDDHVSRHDHYYTLEQHFDWLRAAGFTRCDCLWREGLFAVLSAERA